jgi:diguanylate cyclase (GGDEF)-like protein
MSVGLSKCDVGNKKISDDLRSWAGIPLNWVMGKNSSVFPALGPVRMEEIRGLYASDLLRASDMVELGEIVARTVKTAFGLDSACLIWSRWANSFSGEHFNIEPREALADEHLDVLRDCLSRNLTDHTRGCWILHAGGTVRFALLSSAPGDKPDAKTPGWLEYLDDVKQAGLRLLELEALNYSVKRLRRAEQLQRALFAIANMASSNLEMTDMLRGIHGIVGELMYAENFFITLYDPKRDSLRFLYFADTVDDEALSTEAEIPASDLPHSLTLAMIRTGRSQMGPSLEVRARLGMLKGERLGPESEDWLGVPMIGAGAIRGAVVVQSYLPELRFSEDDRELLTYVAQHILTALERKQAMAELERRVEERTLALANANVELQQEVSERQRGERLQRALFQIAEQASAADSMDSFYASVHAIVGELLNARNLYIALATPGGDELEFPYSVDEIDKVPSRRPILNGLTEQVLFSGRALLLDQAGVDELIASGTIQSLGIRARCWLGVPLICEDRPVGVLAVQSYTNANEFTERDQELLTFVAYHIANGLERKRAQESLRHAYAELEERVAMRTRELATANIELTEQIYERELVEARLMHQALHDALTGLPNRTLLLDRLDAALSTFQKDPSRRFAVLFLDLDRFKVINDSVGHLVGDEMLKQAATRLAGCSPYLVARLGGDEFAVLLHDLDTDQEAIDLAHKMLDALEAPVRIADKEVFTSASIGIAYVDTHYVSAGELLRDADVAMYRAKAQGRQRVEIFDECLRAKALQTLDLESDLRRALVRDEFEPHFQSIVSLLDGHVLGYEALLRWRHPERGLLAPDDFLDAAEDNGCIEQIDWMLFAKACEQAKALPEDTYISINISALRLRAPDFDRRVLNVIAASGLPPQRIRLEITEGVLLQDPDQVRAILLRLREAGVLVQLDDFGTGYSSLSYLHRFPIHSLKIDRSFVSDLAVEGHSPVVVRAITALAASLEIEVIAEGVETEAQRQALLELGCRIGQGFLYAHPEVIDRVEGYQSLPCAEPLDFARRDKAACLARP